MILPRYIVERSGACWAIWDTVEHEYTGFEFETKLEASEKSESINAIDRQTKKLVVV